MLFTPYYACKTIKYEQALKKSDKKLRPALFAFHETQAHTIVTKNHKTAVLFAG